MHVLCEGACTWGSKKKTYSTECSQVVSQLSTNGDRFRCIPRSMAVPISWRRTFGPHPPPREHTTPLRAHVSHTHTQWPTHHKHGAFGFPVLG